ncbi:SWIM zinc finger family protein [Spirosoma harenae]
MAHFTEEQIQSLAPDAASLKAGKDLSINSKKWPTRAVSDRVLWGEVQGSGKDPYRTQIDLINIAFKCSCPSRKFPCKHGLGLLLLYTREPDSFTQTSSEPSWVSDWMDKRVEKTSKVAEPPNESDLEPKLTKTKSQQKRANDRLDSVRAGVADLSRWTEDLIRTGLLSLPDKGSAFWQQTAARMVDAKAPGLATRVKQLGNLPFFDGNGWQSEALRQVGQLYLLMHAFNRLDQLPADLQDDVKTLIGLTVNQKELLESPTADTVTDRFWVLARQTSVEDDLTIQRNYLYGQRSERFAFILNFAFRNTPIQTMLVPGTSVDAALVFYPGRWPYRAVLKEQSTTKKNSGDELPTGCADWSVAQQVLTDVVSQSPWFDEVPQIVGSLTLLTENGRHYLRDTNGLSQPISPNWSSDSYYKWLALSGGNPVKAFVLRLESSVLPLGIWINSSYHLF